MLSRPTSDPMTADQIQRAFKTLADPTRLRLLALLEREELAVQELMQALDAAQSTVSRHLGILRDAGLLADRREGTWVYYRFARPDAGPWRDAWRLAREGLRDDPLALRDRTALDAVLEARALQTRHWFDSVGPEWDDLRRVFNDDTQRARAIGKLVPSGLIVADIGTGTGILAEELARQGLRVIAVDHSQTMLDAARAKFVELGASDRVDFRVGEANDLPLHDAEVDGAFAHMVLQHLPSPSEALSEMARVVKPGGRIVVVDFVQHDREWMKDKLRVQWQGFGLDTVRHWFADAGMSAVEIEVDAPRGRGADLPATFIAAATRPSVLEPAAAVADPNTTSPT